MATPTTLPASFTAGEVLTAAQMNGLRGAFRVLQVVTGGTTIGTFSVTTSYADSGTSATITPSSTSSKILAIVSLCGGSKESGVTTSGLTTRLVRGATTIAQISVSAGENGVNATTLLPTLSTIVLDSPATTSAVTYKTQFASNSNSAAVYLQRGGENSNIVLMEISA